MKRLTAHESLTYIGYLKNVLEQSGILCVIKNAQLSGGIGEIPFLECLPELWVLRDLDVHRANELLTELENPTELPPQWRCRSCRELIDGQFIVCWNCGTTAEES
jgi:hypothetical protein